MFYNNLYRKRWTTVVLHRMYGRRGEYCFTGLDLEQIELNCNIGFFTLESALSEIMSGLMNFF